MIIVGIPVRPDYKADSRVVAVAENWDRRDDVTSIYATSKLCAYGRDKIIAFAKKSALEPTHIMFLDSDTIPKPEALDELLAHDKDVVSGVVPICQGGSISWNVREDGVFLKKLPDKPFKAESVGISCTLVKMNVFDKLEWPYFKDEVTVGRVLKDESIYFCEKLRAADIDIWIDPKVYCDHIKTVSLLSLINYNKTVPLMGIANLERE